MDPSISLKEQTLVKTFHDIPLLRQNPELLEELLKLNYTMYSHWNYNIEGGAGVFNYLLGLVTINKDLPMFQQINIDHIYAWPGRRVCEDFFVLFERRDGTILISDDLKVVYLVKGIQQSLGEILPDRHLVPRPYMIRTTLLPFDGCIVYDGLMQLISNRVRDHRVVQQRLRATYIKAFNEKQIRVREPRGDDLPAPTSKAPPLIDCSVEPSAASSGQLATLKAKLAADSIIALNRLHDLTKVSLAQPLLIVYCI
jgi:hypothetical protein